MIGNLLKQMWITSEHNCGKAKCEPGWNWHPIPLKDYDLWYVVAGNGKMILQGQAFRLQKGSCFLLRPGDQPNATQDPDDRLTVIFIHFNIEDIQTGIPINPELLPPSHRVIQDTFPIEDLLHKLLHTEYHNEFWRETEFHCLLQSVFLQLYRLHAELQAPYPISFKQQQLIGKVIEQIQFNLDRRISHEELAIHHCLSPQYLSRLFKKVTGISIKEYITRTRMQRAALLLVESSMSISQISDALGYSDIYYFSKHFKQKFGLSPTQYRNQTQPSAPHFGSPES